jgi:hypothetical protein
VAITDPDLKWTELNAIKSWDELLMEERKYKDSAEAYRAIHAALGWAVDAELDEGAYELAIEYCELMRDIEGHTNVD